MAMTLKAARINKGLSRTEVAEIFNVAYDTVANWENEKTYPTVDTAIKLCDLYGCTINDIIFCTKNTEKP